MAGVSSPQSGASGVGGRAFAANRHCNMVESSASRGSTFGRGALNRRARRQRREEIIMGIRSLADVMSFWTGIDATMLSRASAGRTRDGLPGAVQQRDRGTKRLCP